MASESPFIPSMANVSGQPSPQPPVVPLQGGPHGLGTTQSQAWPAGAYPQPNHPQYGAHPPPMQTPYAQPPMPMYSPFVAQPVLPQQHNPYAPGVSAEWSGWPQGHPAMATPYTPHASGYVPVIPQTPAWTPYGPPSAPAFGFGGPPPMVPPQQTGYPGPQYPYSAPPGAPPQNWGQFAQPQNPYPPFGAGGGGYPPAGGDLWGGGPPVAAGFAAGVGHGWAAPPPQRRNLGALNEGLDHVDRFTAGSSYGPVLTPMLVHILRIKLDVNPMLLPEDGPGPEGRKHLEWNMIFESNAVHLSGDAPNKSWSKGREAPATFPRVSQLFLMCMVPTFPWYVHVNASNAAIGVTCGDVIEGLSKLLRQSTNKKNWEWVGRLRHGRDQQQLLMKMYEHNRSTAPGVPGGALGEGMRKLDFLADSSWWGGLSPIDVSTAEGKERMRHFLQLDALPGLSGIPCLLEFKTESRSMRSAEETQAFAEAAGQRARRNSLVPPPRAGSGRSRAGSRASLSRGGSSPNRTINVESPTTSSSDESDH